MIEAGRRQAIAMAPALQTCRFTVVLSSPMRRALETCELAGFASGATVCDDLCEWDYGEYEGLTTPQIRSQVPGWYLWRDGCPGGEQPDQVGARADRVLALVAAADGDALLFGHSHIMRVLSARALEQPVAFGARLALSAGSLCVLGFERGTRVIRRWNAVPDQLL